AAPAGKHHIHIHTHTLSQTLTHTHTQLHGICAFTHMYKHIHVDPLSVSLSLFLIHLCLFSAPYCLSHSSTTLLALSTLDDDTHSLFMPIDSHSGLCLLTDAHTRTHTHTHTPTHTHTHTHFYVSSYWETATDSHTPPPNTR